MRIVVLTEAQYGELTDDPHYKDEWSHVLVVMDDHTDEVLEALWFDNWVWNCPEDLTVSRYVTSLVTQLGHTVKQYVA